MSAFATMTLEERICEECGMALPPNAPQGLCPRCLAEMGLGLVAANSGTGPRLSASPDPKPQSQNSTLRYFGDYELLKEIARGGMGVVYKARQVSLNRIVAVKMLLFGEFASDEFVRRFHGEAEAVATLQHPNIVAIHEIGQHQGQYYFSMDYVEGKNLGEHVSPGPLAPRRAANYLKTISEAINYAHQQGVLHRDLKPSNVLIDQSDLPRITDFGLAKRLNVDSKLTATGRVLGSPGFMPPEQADPQRTNAGPQSDIYSLGAILYHLLTGRPPFLAETLEETLFQLLNAEPAPLRLINPSVPRDLETICLKCLNKQPQSRYSSAAELALELDRWLKGQPIRARAAGLLEKVWRWARRDPVMAGLSGAVALLLLAVTLASTGMLAKEKRAKEIESKLLLQAQAAEKKAVSAADKSKQVSILLEHILQVIGPAVPLATQEKILGLAAEQVRRDFAGRPETQLELSLALARAYHETGLYRRMEEMAREAVQLAKVCFREPHPTISAALAILGDALMHLHDLKQAEVVSRQALEMQQALVGQNHADLVSPLNTLGVILQREGKLDEAESIFRQALELQGGENLEAAGLLENIGHVLRDKRRYAEAERVYREVLSLRQKLLGEDHQDVATSLHNLARVLYDQGDFAEAETMFANVVVRRRKLLGEEHPAVATSLHSMGLVLEAESKWAQAEPLFRNALSIRCKLFGQAHPAVTESRNELLRVLSEQGKSAADSENHRDAQ